MKKLLAFSFLISVVWATAQSHPARPRITGIDHVSFYTTSPDATKKFWEQTLGYAAAPPIEPGELVRYMVGNQRIGYSSAPDSKATDRMDHVALRTDDIKALREYLIAHGIGVPEIETSEHSLSFKIKDPEGHRIEFIQHIGKLRYQPSSLSQHIIHAGFLVYDRAAEDHFYKDILGFHIYWHGGMKDNETDWAAMQVPDGTDWIEYMLNQPAHPDLQLTGVMNHISLGVPDIKKAQAVLESHGWKSHGDEKAEMGRDGKWQLNVYDPDYTRVELMEFKPAQKPCCSEFTGLHPTE